MSSQLELDFSASRQPRQRLQPGNRRNRVRMAVVALICGAVGYALFGQFAQNGRLDDQVSALASQNQQLQRQIDQDQTEIVLAQTPAWLEEQARKLGYVLPGERVFVITTPGAAMPAKGGVPAPLPSFTPATPRPTPTPSASPSGQFFVLPVPPSPGH